MQPTGPSSRRAVLALGAGALLTTAMPTAAYAVASGGGEISRQLSDLEAEYAARIGVFARDTATGRTVAYRADELFPMCSVFKTLAAAAVLRDLDRNGEFLAKRIRYTKEYVTDIGHVPETSKPENIANGMTVEELCSATVSHSDNGAGNLRAGPVRRDRHGVLYRESRLTGLPVRDPRPVVSQVSMAAGHLGGEHPRHRGARGHQPRDARADRSESLMASTVTNIKRD